MSLEAEQTIIGSIMIDSKVIPQVLEALSEDDFLNSSCRMIFEACKEMFMQDAKPDVITVMNRLSEKNRWSEQDLKDYKIHITEMAEIVPTVSNIAQYINIVKADAMRTRAADKTAMLAVALAGRAEVSECQSLATGIVDALNGTTTKAAVSAKDGIVRFIKSQFETKEYIKTGIKQIDENARIKKGHMVVIGGRPSAGKTAFTLQIAMVMARTLNVAYFSLETGEDEVYERMISCFYGLDFGRIQDRHNSIWDTVAGQSEFFAKLKIDVIDAAGWTMEKISATASQLQADVIFIDYLQLVSGPGKSEYERVSNVSLAAKTMSRTTNRLVVALSQLSRSNTDSPPTMQDLRSSGQIEQDANSIIFIHNPDPQEQIGKRQVIIAKNKNGRTGITDMWFDGTKQTFTALEGNR